MNKTYTAVYLNPSGRFYNATIFLSSITLSIRFTDEHNQIMDVYWLAADIVSLEQDVLVSILTYRNKNGQTERLTIRDPELLHAIKKHFGHHRFIGGWKHRIFGSTRTKIFLFLSVTLAIILAGYFLFVPWLGDRIAKSISKEWEINMGQKLHQAVMQEFKVDTVRTQLINFFFKELHYDVQYPVSITVVQSKEVNAFAVPGGPIVVYSSILEKLRGPEELAALLSHETSHIELRHSLRNMFGSLARKMFLVLLIGDQSGLAAFFIDNADNLKGLEYSRALETEADDHGISLMRSSGINATGMLGLMQVLQAETKGEEPSAFLSTHPIFTSRIENIKSQLESPRDLPTARDTLSSIFKQLQAGERSW